MAGGVDANLCISESEFAKTLSLGGGIRTSAYRNHLRARRAYCSENILGHDLEIDVTDASLAILLRQEARAAAMNADSIQYALETDCPVGAAGFEPLHTRIGICPDSQPGDQDSNLRISPTAKPRGPRT